MPLTPFQGRFGHNPRPGQRYDLIWFYESFHHCLDFQDVVSQLGEHLAEGGRVILGGEPIVEKEYDAVPYPWGVRLHSEVVAVVSEAALVRARLLRGLPVRAVRSAGFKGRRIDCEPTLFGRLYVFGAQRVALKE